MNFNRYLYLSGLALFALILAACSSATPTPSPTEAPVVEDPPASESSVIVKDQDASGGSVIIEDVHAAQAGWIGIHISQDGAPGPIIGYAPVQEGENHDVEVEIDLSQATEGLFAMLHIDAGTVGEYEFPGDDVPVRVDDTIVNVPFVLRSSTGASEEAKVMVVDNSFQAKEITVPLGTTVVWQMSAGLPHTVTADDGLFDSGRMTDGDTFTFTFTEAGEFPYYCAFHGGPGGRGMSGTLIVTGE